MTEITRLFDFPYYQLEAHNLEAALVTKYDGEWIKTSTQEYLDKISIGNVQNIDNVRAISLCK